MDYVDKSRRLSQLTIPGTHDSGAYYVGGDYFTQTQTMDIRHQLDAGIRALDIRLGGWHESSCPIPGAPNQTNINDSGQYLHVMHVSWLGSSYVGQCEVQTFDDVLNTVFGFLKVNNHETVLMRVDDSTSSCSDPAANYIPDCPGSTNFGDLVTEALMRVHATAKATDGYFNVFDPSLVPPGDATNPTLKEMAGKLVILYNFTPPDSGPWVQTTWTGLSPQWYGIPYPHGDGSNGWHLEDNYSLSSLFNIAEKWNAEDGTGNTDPSQSVYFSLKRAATDFPGVKDITYVSAAGGAFPFTFASGLSTHNGDLIPTIWDSSCDANDGQCLSDYYHYGDWSYFKGLNELTYDVLNGNNGDLTFKNAPKLGIVFADFPGPGNCGASCAVDPLHDKSGLIGTLISFNAHPLAIPPQASMDVESLNPLGSPLPSGSVTANQGFLLHLSIHNPNGAEPGTPSDPLAVSMPLYPDVSYLNLDNPPQPGQDDIHWPFTPTPSASFGPLPCGFQIFNQPGTFPILENGVVPSGGTCDLYFQVNASDVTSWYGNLQTYAGLGVGAPIPPWTTSGCVSIGSATVQATDVAQNLEVDTTTNSANMCVGAQQITGLVPPAYAAYVGDDYGADAFGGSSSQPFTFTLDGSSRGCALRNPSVGATPDEHVVQVTFDFPGTCVIDANQLGDANFTAAPQAQISFPVTVRPQSITFTNSPSSSFVAVGTQTVTTATAGVSPQPPVKLNPIQLSVVPVSGFSNVCSLNGDGKTITFANQGLCEIKAHEDRAGGGFPVAAADVIETFIVEPSSYTPNNHLLAQQLNLKDPETAVGIDLPIESPIGGSGNPVVFRLDDQSTANSCSLGSQGLTTDPTTGTPVYLVTVHPVHAGLCVVDAFEDGNNQYASGFGSTGITVYNGPQSITFNSQVPTNAIAGGPNYTVAATGGASGNPVVLSIDGSASSVCSISGSTVTFDQQGTCVIDANQAGNFDYTAAPQVQQSFSVQPAAVVASATAPPLLAHSPFTVTFASPVSGVTTSNLTVNEVGPIPIAGTLNCFDATNAAVNCASGPVTVAELTPTKPLIAGEYYFALANYTSGGIVSYIDGAAVPSSQTYLRAQTAFNAFQYPVSYKWETVKNTSALGGSYVEERYPGATETFTATGTSVGIVTWDAPDGGIATVTVTNGKKPPVTQTIDTFAASAGDQTTTISGLTSGSHTVTIGVDGTSDASSTGQWVRVDATVVSGVTHVSPTLTALWPNYPGNYAYSGAAGATVSLRFRGTGVVWTAFTGPNDGRAKVVIDGTKVATEDLYAAGYGSTPYTFTGLSMNGFHTITITVLGTKDQHSSDVIVTNQGFAAQ
jgi:hypothetical protein